MELKIVAVTQARIGSTRLPGKVLKLVNGIPLLQIHLERIKQSKLINEFIVATTNEDGVEYIEQISNKVGFKIFKGSINNVLERFYFAVKDLNADFIVRITSDCPLIDAKIIDLIIDKCVSGNYDYVSNTLKPTFPDGLDIEIFTMDALKLAYENATLASEIEHVTPYIWKQSTFFGNKLFKSFCFQNSIDLSNLRLTVDEQIDLELIIQLTKQIGFDKEWMEYVNYMQQYNLENINISLNRNDGYSKSIQND